MSNRAAFASVLHLFVVFVFFALGLAFVLFPHLPQVKLRILDLLSERSEACMWIGWSFFFTDFILLLSFYALSRGRYLRIRSENRLTEIDVNLIRQSLEECFRQQFPQKLSLLDVEISPASGLELGLVFTSCKEQNLLPEIEKTVKTLLRERFGYTQPFHFILKL